MSRERSGVQQQLRDQQPRAFYMHWTGHSLNLTIVHSCCVPQLRICIDQIKDFTLWLKAFLKQKGLLKSIYEHGIQQTSTSLRFLLLNVYVTRWLKKIDGWEQFSMCHPFLCEMCEVIIIIHTVAKLVIMRCSLTITQLKTREMLLLIRKSLTRLSLYMH